jgi:hypothetical protein
LRRTFSQPLSVADVRARGRSSDWCYDMHKVDWRGSFLSTNGHTLLCWFTATDAESVRMALRKSGADVQYLWPGTVHEGSAPTVPNVILERFFQEPVTVTESQCIAEAAAGCLQAHGVKHARTFLALDRKRMICLYEAPDAEAVRNAQREIALPPDNIWPFFHVHG